MVRLGLNISYARLVLGGLAHPLVTCSCGRLVWQGQLACMAWSQHAGCLYAGTCIVLGDSYALDFRVYSAMPQGFVYFRLLTFILKAIYHGYDSRAVVHVASSHS